MGRRLRIYTSCRKFILVTAIFIVASELIGCGGGSSSTAPAAASIKLSPTVGSLNLGGTLQFSSVALNSINKRESECLTALDKAFRNRIAIPLPGMCSK